MILRKKATICCIYCLSRSVGGKVHRMIKILKEKETDKIIEFVKKEMKDNSDFFISGLQGTNLLNGQLLRHYIFSTDAICVADVGHNDEIQKLLAVSMPKDGMKKKSIDIDFISIDSDFVNEAVQELRDLLEGEGYTKLSLSVRKPNDNIRLLPEFEEEVRVDTKYYKEFTYSYFI